MLTARGCPTPRPPPGDRLACCRGIACRITCRSGERVMPLSQPEECPARRPGECLAHRRASTLLAPRGNAPLGARGGRMPGVAQHIAIRRGTVLLSPKDCPTLRPSPGITPRSPHGGSAGKPLNTVPAAYGQPSAPPSAGEALFRRPGVPDVSPSAGEAPFPPPGGARRFTLCRGSAFPTAQGCPTPRPPPGDRLACCRVSACCFTRRPGERVMPLSQPEECPTRRSGERLAHRWASTLLAVRGCPTPHPLPRKRFVRR